MKKSSFGLTAIVELKSAFAFLISGFRILTLSGALRKKAPFFWLPLSIALCAVFLSSCKFLRPKEKSAQTLSQADEKADAEVLNKLSQEQQAFVYLHKMSKFLSARDKEFLFESAQNLEKLDNEVVSLARVHVWKSSGENDLDQGFESRGPLFITEEKNIALLSALAQSLNVARAGVDETRKEDPTSEYLAVGCPERLKGFRTEESYEISSSGEAAIEPQKLKSLGAVLEKCAGVFEDSKKQWEVDLFVSTKTLGGKNISFREVHVRPRALWFGQQWAQSSQDSSFAHTLVFIEKKPLPEKVQVWIQSAPDSNQFSVVRDMSTSEAKPSADLSWVLSNRPWLAKAAGNLNVLKKKESYSLQDLSNLFKEARNFQNAENAVGAALSASAPYSAWHGGHLIGQLLASEIFDTASQVESFATVAAVFVTGYRLIDLGGFNDSLWAWLDRNDERVGWKRVQTAMRAIDLAFVTLALSSDIVYIRQNLGTLMEALHHVKMLEINMAGQMAGITRTSHRGVLRLIRTLNKAMGEYGKLTRNMPVYQQAIKSLKAMDQMSGRAEKIGGINARIQGLLAGRGMKGESEVLKAARAELEKCLFNLQTENRLSCFQVYLDALDGLLKEERKELEDAYSELKVESE